MRGYMYNQGLDPCDSLTSLMTVQLPMTFQLTWLFIFMCVHWTSTLHYYWFTIYMAHNSDVAFDNSWHDLTWHSWHGLACWGGNVKPLLVLSDRCVLGCAFSSPLHSLVVWGLQWSLVLSDSFMHVFPLLFLDKLLCFYSGKWFSRHAPLLLFLLHHLAMTWECTCSCNSLMTGRHQFENSLL